MTQKFALHGSFEEIKSFVRQASSDVLATLHIMKKDDSVEWNGLYGDALNKLDSDLSSIFIRSCKYLPSNETALLYAAYDSCVKKHKDTIDCVECYVQSTFE